MIPSSMILATTFEEAIELTFIVGLIGIVLSGLLWKFGGYRDLGGLVLGRFLGAMIVVTILSGGVWYFLKFGLF